MVEYLYAAYTLDNSDSQGVILGIAKEEMGHLLTVQNILIFLGAPINFGRAPVKLSRLTHQVLQRFINLEEKGNEVNRLYTKIISLLKDEDSITNECLCYDSLQYQACADEWGRSNPNLLIIRVATREQALDALRAIDTQGSFGPNSHLARFQSIKPVMADAPPAAKPLATTGPWVTMFNLRYHLLLAYSALSFQLAREGTEALLRGAVINKLFGEMYNLAAIARILTAAGGAPQFATPPTLVPSWYLPLNLTKKALDLSLDLPSTTFSRALRSLDSEMAEWLALRSKQ
jgi:hypothetical protein